MSTTHTSPPSNDPREVINGRIRSSLREDALTAAAILRWTPDLIGDEKVWVWLKRIGAGTIRDEVVEAWLLQARVSPLRRGCDLDVRQRYALSAQLQRFAKERG